MKRILTISLILLTVSSVAQDRMDQEVPIVSKPFAILSKATGCMFDENMGKWTEYPNRLETIKRLDQFDRFEFSIATFKGDKYLLLRKDYEIGHYEHPMVKEGWAGHDAFVDWVIDLKTYKEKMANLTTGDFDVSFDVVACNFDIVGHQTEKKTQIVIDEKGTKQTLVFKFRLDEANKKTRFFIYSREELGEGFSIVKFMGDNHDYYSHSPEGEAISSSELYNHFYYETDLNTFLNFLKAPLTQ